MSDNNGGMSGILTFLAGVITGSVVTTIILTQEEKFQVKEKILEATDDMSSKVKEASENAKKKVNEVIEFSKQKLEEQKSIWAEAIDAGKEAIRKERELLRSEKSSGIDN